jgi:uncharacterized protein (DUF983 family)
MLGRAVRRRCPWCGGRGAFFTGWFAKQPHCATCGLTWRRDDVGFELGAATAAVILTMVPLIGALAVVGAVTWPDLAVIPMLVILGAAACVLPVVMYPISYTAWQAVDIAMRPVDLDRDFVDPRRLDGPPVRQDDA